MLDFLESMLARLSGFLQDFLHPEREDPLPFDATSVVFRALQYTSKPERTVQHFLLAMRDLVVGMMKRLGGAGVSSTMGGCVRSGTQRDPAREKTVRKRRKRTAHSFTKADGTPEL